ncbi:MAG TPA: hypothetical protein VEN79_17100 [Terriglobia bacterium]|nr:hypothetical protein [Terriglobia bacterium]
MNCGARQMAVGLLASVAIWAQAGQKGDPSAPQEQPQQERPTLGPRNGPTTPSGPNTSTTNDVRKLMRIHTLYIESIDNSLSDKLIEALGKWGRFHLVTKAKDADATLRGSCLESRRLKHVHSEIFISDRNGASIWQDSIYRPFNPPALDQAVSDTATLVEAHLEEALREGSRD